MGELHTSKMVYSYHQFHDVSYGRKLRMGKCVKNGGNGLYCRKCGTFIKSFRSFAEKDEMGFPKIKFGPAPGKHMIDTEFWVGYDVYCPTNRCRVDHPRELPF